MADPKNLELFSTLSGFEKRSFKKYLASGFFNCPPEVNTLFDLSSNGKKTKSRELFKKLFPKKAYNDKLYRYTVSELNKHIENFLLIKYLNSEKLTLNILKAKALGLKDCRKSYSYIHNDISKSNTPKNSAYYLRQYEHAEWHLYFTNKNAGRKISPDYSQTLFNLDTFYFLKKLQLACELTNIANILKTTYENTLIDEIKETVIREPFCNILNITIYYNILEILDNPENEGNFNLLIELLKKRGDEIDTAELSEMYQYLKNYCVKKINQGESNYVRILFDIYNDILENKNMWKKEYLSQWEFKNIVTLSLRLNENKWCEIFIKKYINYLHPKDRKNALAYNQAYYYFMTGQFRKAIKKLQEVELSDVFYQLDARVIILKSYYELDETEAFFYHASAFRLFLLRNRKISEYQRNIYRNLIKFLSAIMRANGSKTKLKRIENNIKEEKNVADLKWLLEKVGENI